MTPRECFLVAVAFQRSGDGTQGFFQMDLMRLATKVVIVVFEGRPVVSAGESGTQRQHTMHKITVRSNQFTVYLLNKVGPVKVRIVVLWHVHAQVVSKRIGVVSVKE